VVIACGALGGHIREITARNGWPVELHCLPAMLHNRPSQITPHAERIARGALARGRRVAIAYADCGTYGALDAVCDELGLQRLPGLHCYDLYDGEEALAARLEAEPGTYLLTDFLVRSFERTVIRELGLDRWPELRDDYFRHYTRVVWLAQEPDAELRTLAQQAADRLGLPLTVVPTGTGRLEQAMSDLLAGALSR
jgi:hypothetical protein